MAAKVPDPPGTPGGLSFQHIHTNDSHAKIDLIFNIYVLYSAVGLMWVDFEISHCLFFDVLLAVALSQETDATLADAFAKSDDVDFSG